MAELRTPLFDPLRVATCRYPTQGLGGKRCLALAGTLLGAPAVLPAQAATNTAASALCRCPDRIKPHAKLVSTVPNPDLCGRGANGGTTTGIACFIGDVQPGASETITFGLQPLSTGTLAINAAASFFDNALWQTWRAV